MAVLVEYVFTGLKEADEMEQAVEQAAALLGAVHADNANECAAELRSLARILRTPAGWRVEGEAR